MLCVHLHASPAGPLCIREEVYQPVARAAPRHPQTPDAVSGVLQVGRTPLFSPR